MIDRRTMIGAIAALPFVASSACAQSPAAAPAEPSGLNRRIIPGADQAVPTVGIGTARRYADPQSEADLAPLRASIARFAELGGQMIDTAPSYGRAEQVVGQIVQELNLRGRLFLATKVGADNREEGAAQIERSFTNLRTDRIDLIAVHNLRDVTNQLAILRDLKSARRIRSLGATTSSDQQYADFEAMMRRESLDVIQVDYALDNRGAADRILPLAMDRGMAVMINLPFGRGRLFEATRDRPLPEWTAEFDAASWAQFFLKYILSHPSAPIAIPGMAQTRYIDDNLGAARGRLPDAAMRRRMEQFIESL